MPPCLANFLYFLVEMGFHHVGQAGLELSTSGDPPALASQSAGIIGVSHCAQQEQRLLTEVIGLMVPGFLLIKMYFSQRKASDPNRFTNRGGNLLKEEKQRAKLQKMLPKVILLLRVFGAWLQRYLTICMSFSFYCLAPK